MLRTQPCLITGHDAQPSLACLARHAISDRCDKASGSRLAIGRLMSGTERIAFPQLHARKTHRPVSEDIACPLQAANTARPCGVRWPVRSSPSARARRTAARRKLTSARASRPSAATPSVRAAQALRSSGPQSRFFVSCPLLGGLEYVVGDIRGGTHSSKARTSCIRCTSRCLPPAVPTQNRRSDAARADR